MRHLAPALLALVLVLVACASTTPSPPETASPTSTTPLTPTSTPTPTPSPTSTTPPTPTSTPTPTPQPTLTDEQVAAAHLSQTIPWLGSPPDALHWRAAESVIGLWIHDAKLGDSVARMKWVVDGLTDDEAGTLASLWRLATDEPKLTGLLLQLPWVVDAPGDVPGSVEWDLFRFLVAIGLDSPELGLLLATHPLLADDVTFEKWEVVQLLVETGFSDLDWAKRLAATDWVSDGIEEHELRLFSAVVSTADSPTSPSEFLLGIPSLTDHLTGDLRAHVTRALTGLALDGQEHLEQVTVQQWFDNGLEEEEAVLVVILERAARDSPALFRDLLAAHFSETRTVELPLTGRIRLWVVQNTPIHDGEDLLQTMEDTVRYLEELVPEPFPTNDIILSVVDPSEEIYGVRGEWLNTHMRLLRNPRSGTVAAIPHETGHFIFKGLRWYSEGASELVQAYVNHRTGVQTLDQRREQLAMGDRCARYANIRHWAHETEELGPTPGDLCPYVLGEHLLLNLWRLIGQDGVSAALRELYVINRERRELITEDLVFNVFLSYVPAGKQEDFRDLYGRLHGGSFAFQDTNFDDDHGDKAADASIAVAGQSLTGELDYLFDFDYFRFQAQEGQRYRIIVQHPSLPSHWITIYAPDGVTQEIYRWESRSATPSGSEILWSTPTAGMHYVAVRNFGGLSGTYTLTIAPIEDAPDDHGDTPDSATSLTLGQTVNGTIDDFDLDYFRFQAEQGQWFHVEVLGETLEILSVGLYEADGATPADMRREDVEAIESGGGTFVDIRDLKNAAWSPGAAFDWIAPRAGGFFLTVSGAQGKVGAYTVTITMLER